MGEETKVKAIARSAERFVTKPVSEKAMYVKGYWKAISFQKIKKGYIFRLWDHTNSGNRVPDHTVDGRHDVCVAVGDAFEKEGTPGVECISIQL